MLRAFPFLKYQVGAAYWASTSTNLGCDIKIIGSEPTVVEWFLNVGESEARKNYESPYLVYEDEVHNGYGLFMPFTPGKVGYDINSIRATYTGAVVSVTLRPGPGMEPITLSRTLTEARVEALFRDDPQWNFDDRGVSLGQYTWPDTSTIVSGGGPVTIEIGGGDWPYPHWTINSVTLA
jgi:hypothetical protein